MESSARCQANKEMAVSYAHSEHSQPSHLSCPSSNSASRMFAPLTTQHAAGDMYVHLVFLLISGVQLLEILFWNVKVILHMGRHFRLLVKGFNMGFRLPAINVSHCVAE